MVELEWRMERREGITLVGGTLRNDGRTAKRVRLRSALEGPVWPPRRRSTVAPEWTDRTWTGTGEPGARRGVGFASPAAVVEPPVELVSATRPNENDSSDDVRTVLSSLSSWTPPRSSRARGGPTGDRRRHGR